MVQRGKPNSVAVRAPASSWLDLALALLAVLAFSEAVGIGTSELAVVLERLGPAESLISKTRSGTETRRRAESGTTKAWRISKSWSPKGCSTKRGTSETSGVRLVPVVWLPTAVACGAETTSKSCWTCKVAAESASSASTLAFATSTSALALATHRSCAACHALSRRSPAAVVSGDLKMQHIAFLRLPALTLIAMHKDVTMGLCLDEAEALLLVEKLHSA